jgi:hypothetical protein
VIKVAVFSTKLHNWLLRSLPAGDQQRYGHEALWSRICSADYSEVEAGRQTSCRLGRFRDFDHMNTNSWKQAR